MLSALQPQISQIQSDQPETRYITCKSFYFYSQRECHLFPFLIDWENKVIYIQQLCLQG